MILRLVCVPLSIPDPRSHPLNRHHPFFILSSPPAPFHPPSWLLLLMLQRRSLVRRGRQEAAAALHLPPTRMEIRVNQDLSPYTVGVTAAPASRLHIGCFGDSHSGRLEGGPGPSLIWPCSIWRPSSFLEKRRSLIWLDTAADIGPKRVLRPGNRPDCNSSRLEKFKRCRLPVSRPGFATLPTADRTSLASARNLSTAKTTLGPEYVRIL